MRCVVARFNGKKMFVLGAPYSLGQPKSGVELAPRYLMDFGLLECLARSNSYFVQYQELEKCTRPSELHATYKAAGKCYRHIYEAIVKQNKKADLCLTLGGDHSVAIGSIAAMASRYENLRVIWVDAPGDANTLQTSPSGNLHGMPLALILGWLRNELPREFSWIKTFIKPEHVALVGVRALDKEEERLINKAGIWCATAQDVRKQGMKKIIQTAFKATSAHGKPTHLSFDIDVLDPKVAPSTGTPEGRGMSLSDAIVLANELSQQTQLVGMDMVEINPRIARAGLNSTLSSALEVIFAAAGISNDNVRSKREAG